MDGMSYAIVESQSVGPRSASVADSAGSILRPQPLQLLVHGPDGILPVSLARRCSSHPIADGRLTSKTRPGLAGDETGQWEA